MTTSPIQQLNLVQSICARPRMYTPHGTLAEVYELLTDENGPQPIAGQRSRASVATTLQWLRKNAVEPARIVEELLERHGTDQEALRAIGQFAATLPPD